MFAGNCALDVHPQNSESSSHKCSASLPLMIFIPPLIFQMWANFRAYDPSDVHMPYSFTANTNTICANGIILIKFAIYTIIIDTHTIWCSGIIAAHFLDDRRMYYTAQMSSLERNSCRRKVDLASDHISTAS